MPFSNGVFTNVTGASSAVAGQIVQSAVWNAIHVDYSTALNQVMNQAAYQTPFRNILWCNGSFDVWQRGAGGAAVISLAAAATAYTSDRWYVRSNANQAMTFSEQGASPPLELGGGNYIAITRNSGETGTGTITFGYPLDLFETYKLAGYPGINIRLLARASTGFSPTSGIITIGFYTGTGLASKRGAGFTNETVIVSVTQALALGATAVSINIASTVAIPVTVGQAEFQVRWTPTSTADANDILLLDDVQVEPVYVTGWNTIASEKIPFDVQLYGCKRHYQKTQPYNIAATTGVSAGIVGGLQTIVPVSTQQTPVLWQYPVEMRATPAISTYNPDGGSNRWRNLSLNVSIDANTAGEIGPKSGMIYTTVSGPGSVGVGNFILIHAAASAGI